MNYRPVSLLLILLLNGTCARKTAQITHADVPFKTNLTNMVIDSIPTTLDSNCHIFGPVVSQLTSKQGTITYREGIPLYSITYGIENTFDSKWIGYVCNMPDKFKHIGLKVIFSGKYYHAYKYIERKTAGETNLYLQLDSIRIAPL